MKVYFAYSNEAGHEYDLKKAFSSGKIVKFEMDVKLQAVQSIGESLTTKLLDNQKWQLRAKRRKKQTITTKPDLHLQSFQLKTGADKGKFVTLKDLLTEWYYARSLWINTGSLIGIASTDIKTEYLVKVVRGADDLPFTLHENKNYMESVEFTIETAGSY